jgi:hypothetical protein
VRNGGLWIVLAGVALLLAQPPSSTYGQTVLKRIGFIVETWVPRSHADVIGTRFLEGYKVGNKVYRSPLTIASVYPDAPRPNDQTRALAARYGFRAAASVADALLDDPRAARPRLAVDGILIATREDPRESGQAPSPTPRLQLLRQVYGILDQTGAKVPIFIDKMLAANWADSQAIVADAARRGIPLMAGSVLPYTPLDRPMRSGKPEVSVAIAAGPYWAYAFHLAEFLQGYMEQRGPRETGVTSLRDVGAGYGSLPDRDRWGGRVFDALLSSARTRRGGGTAAASILLIQYADGTRAVMALLPRAMDEAEFLLGAQFADGTISTGGLILPHEPFDHFGYLVQALAEFYTTGRAPVPVERALLTTGIVLLGQDAHQTGSPQSSPALAVSYPAPRAHQ